MESALEPSFFNGEVPVTLKYTDPTGHPAPQALHLQAQRPTARARSKDPKRFGGP